MATWLTAISIPWSTLSVPLLDGLLTTWATPHGVCLSGGWGHNHISVPSTSTSLPSKSPFHLTHLVPSQATLTFPSHSVQQFFLHLSTEQLITHHLGPEALPLCNHMPTVHSRPTPLPSATPGKEGSKPPVAKAPAKLQGSPSPRSMKSLSLEHLKCLWKPRKRNCHHSYLCNHPMKG